VGGRHRGPGLPKRVRAVIVAMVLVVGAGVFMLWRTAGGDETCSGELRLTIAAAPEIAPVLAHASVRWSDTARGPRGECVAIEVTSAEPADVALAIADRAGVALAGLTSLAPAGGTPRSVARSDVEIPDVWVPDSSTWLVRLRSAAPSLVPPQALAVATSPVVLAVPEPAAGALGWPTQLPTWNLVMQRLTSGQPLRVGVVEPNRDAVGLASLVALGTAAASANDSDIATVAIMRALFAGRAAGVNDLLSRFPRSTDPADVADALGAAPLAERSLIAYNATRPPVPLAAVYVQPAPPALDYPYVVLPGLATDRQRLAERFRQALAGDQYLDDLAEIGLRGPDGMARFPAMPGAPATITTGQLDDEAVAKALATWVSLTRPSRMLAVIDISGSMAYPVPSAGNATRAQIALEAARQGMMLFDDSWSVGLWTFATRLNGNVDHLEVVPIRPMTENRDALVAALGTIRPDPVGNTGLYDTVLAAYQEVQSGWDPAAVNSVVLLTDGQNDDPDGITLDQLIASLQELVDPQRPIQVIAIGIGDDVSQVELERITSTTGGGTFIARDPSAIGPIFLRALSLRPPAPV
jgi:Uncharacterized protein containing a von Willebrand factor type A (vWA) domain